MVAAGEMAAGTDVWATIDPVLHSVPDSEHEDVKPILNKEGRQKLASFGKAKEDPNSEERREQLMNLWAKNMPDLHVVVPFESGWEEDWMAIFLPLQRDQ